MEQFGSFEENYLSGKCLYGDDFDSERIRQWFAEEENGYYQLTAQRGKYVYSYHALNEWLAFRYLKRGYQLCVALGCAGGDDIRPLASRVERFIAIEPAEKWWRNRIGETPVVYLRPDFTGDIPLSSSQADLLVSLGVLHHIPNVSHVLDEIARVLAPEGQFVLREPISSMGDWRKPRRGLTANERGLPAHWLDEALRAHGFECIKRSYCCFPALSRILCKLGFSTPYNHKWVVAADFLLSQITKSNVHYHRVRWWHKLAPASLFYVLRKRPEKN